jgi:RimJ/RimL family protein N-acetyltransferase
VTAPPIRLRPLTYEDWPRVHEWASVPEVSRYQDWGPNTEADTQAFARAAVQGWSHHPRRQHVWAAVDADDVPVGSCEVNLRGPGVAEIGYVVHPDLWRRGLGRAVATLVRDVSFELLDAHRLHATCDPRNLASAAVLRGIGMVREGTLRENIRLRDGWRDSAVFGLLREEWRALGPEPVGDRVRFG